MKKFFTLILIFFTGHIAMAQLKVRQKDSLHLFVSTFDTVCYNDAREGYKCLSLKRLSIYERKGTKKTQTIIMPKDITNFDGWPYLEGYIKLKDVKYAITIEDMNFDGYNDFSITSYICNRGICEYNLYWFYNKTSGTFVRDSTFDHFSNISFDRVKKTIHTFYEDTGSFESPGNWNHALYKWNKNKLELIAEEKGEGEPRDRMIRIPLPSDSVLINNSAKKKNQYNNHNCFEGKTCELE